MKKKSLKPGLNSNDQYGNIGISNFSSKIQNQISTEDFEISDCIKFVKSVRVALKLFTIEIKFITKIIDCDEKLIINKILEKIFDPVLRYLKNEAEVMFFNFSRK